MKKIGIAVFLLMFVGVAYVGAQSVEVDFDRVNTVQNGKTMEKFSMPEAFLDIEYNIPVPKREVKYEMETLKNVEFQEFIPIEVCSSADVSVSTTDLIIIGTIDENRQTCIISDDKLSCTLLENKDDFESEMNGLMLARTVYLDRMLSVWMLTHNIKEACPSGTQYVCTGGIKYACTHKKVFTGYEYRPCTASELGIPHGCPPSGMIKYKKYACHVSCKATSETCKGSKDLMDHE